LGGARTITNEPVMDVVSSQNRYFQATVLDTYTSQAWELRNTVEVNLATQKVPAPEFKARRIITQTVTMRQMTNVIMGAPMPVSVSVPADARVIPYGLTPEETLTAERIGVSELSLIISHGIIQPGQTYTLTSAISFATEAQLRSDSVDYPSDVIARYLQLPDTVPQRVFDLAEELADGHENPYDIAKGIETYLRGYEYNDQIPGPAPDEDSADYFLFEEKQGYCDYYATSMAVMLRHLGIPTRLVQGYATGEYDPLSGAYRFLEKDAHTWVEVYFPTYGWIQFEPTASETAIERQSGAAIPPEEGGGAASYEHPKAGDEAERNIPIPEETKPLTSLAGRTPELTQQFALNLGRMLLLAAVTGLFLVAILMWRLLRTPGVRTKVRMKKQPPRDFIGRLWDRLWWWGERLNMIMRPSLTPLEQAEIFSLSLPDIADDVHLLAQLYARDQYSPHTLAPDDMERAQYAWLRLRSQFIRAWMNRRLRVWRKIRFRP
jgi:transglutaminase-like putative cysteine protease